MKKLLIGILVSLLTIGCQKDLPRYKNIIENPTPKAIVIDSTYCTNCGTFQKNHFENLSSINKTTSWYRNTQSFDRIFPLMDSLPYESWKRVFGFQIDLGGYVYTDLNNDSKKDLFVYYHKSPWPTNEIGLNLFTEYQINKSNFEIQKGLTQIRKLSLADLNKDGSDEIVCFSSGYDKPPFPGDSIQIFYPKDKTYKYLSEDIGYFHTGATGDINNDGLIDILAYSGGSAVIRMHATCYLNKGNNQFELKNDIFKSIRIGFDNFYTMELFDMNNDGWLDILLGGGDGFSILYNNKGIFDNRVDLKIGSNETTLDIGFLDLNKDGKMDLILNSTFSNYNGYKLSAFIQMDNSNFSNNTNEYFDEFENNSNGTWIKWLRFFDYDKDGDVDIVGDGLYGTLLNKKIWWKNDSNKFTKNN
jgi:hypothetical protein